MHKTHKKKGQRQEDSPYLEKRFPWQHLLVDPKRSSYRGLEEFPRRSSGGEKRSSESRRRLGPRAERVNGKKNKPRAERGERASRRPAATKQPFPVEPAAETRGDDVGCVWGIYSGFEDLIVCQILFK